MGVLYIAATAAGLLSVIYLPDLDAPDYLTHLPANENQLFIGALGMLGSLAFGKGFGWLSLALGAVGLVAAVLQMIDPASMIGAGSYFAYLIFYLVLGWKVYSVSRLRT